MRPASAHLLVVAVSALSGCASDGFWDRPYAVGGARAVAAPRAPASPRAFPSPPPTAPLAAVEGGEPAPCAADDRATLAEVNRIRAARGLPAFRWNDRLHDAARDHSAEQRLHGYMGHGSPDAARDDLGDRLRISGYRGRTWAEVVAKGYPDVPSVVDGWMKSRSHREILLDPELEEAGFARDGSYWTGNFGTPLAAPPRPAPPRRTAVAAPRPAPVPSSSG